MKSYVLTVSIQAGRDENTLVGMLTDAGFMPEVLMRTAEGNVIAIRDYIKLKIHIRSEEKRAIIASRISGFGIGIQSLRIDSE